MNDSVITDEEKGAMESMVQDLLKAANFDVSLEAEIENERLYFNVEGPDAHYFSANKGEVLRSFGLLLLTYYNKSFPGKEVEIKFDAGHVLRRREEELRSMAMDAADQLGSEGDSIVLDPLNPYDRRIVHMALKERENLRTESIGDGLFKKLKISLSSGVADENGVEETS